MAQKPVILMAFANDRSGKNRFLNELGTEMSRLGDISNRAFLPMVIPLASGEKIRNAFRYQGELIKVFHYGGHAAKEGLETEASALEAETFTHIDGLSSFIGQHTGLKLAFLNGCNTISHARHFHKAGVACVIASNRAVGDIEARRFSEEFYKSLVAGSSIAESFEAAKASMASIYGDESSFRGLDFGDNKSNIEFPYELQIHSDMGKVAEEGVKSWKPRPNRKAVS